MDDTTESVMIALLPVTTDWCRIELPHLTLVYAGAISDLQASDRNKMTKDAASLALLSRPLTLEVTGVEMFGFGEEQKVDSLRLRATSEILAMRHAVEGWNKSQHEFRPHVTIGPVGTRMFIQPPPTITFDRICVGWGNDYLTFWLNIPGFR